MDVICVTDENNRIHYTEFYIKFRVARVDHEAMAVLGFHDDSATLFLSDPQVTESNKERTLSSAAICPDDDSFTPNDTDFVDMFCNEIHCADIKAAIGPDLILRFLNPTTGSYESNPDEIVFSLLNITPGENNLICKHRLTGVVEEVSIWQLDVSTKLVVMDIDGTITRSNVKGYFETVYLGVFTYIHEGIVDFLLHLEEKHGFKIIYLTSRPMIHKKETSAFLRGIVDQKGNKIPPGPVFLNKDKIIQAIYREVIAKTTVTFKSQALVNISQVFSAAGSTKLSPFILGIGNKESDAIAYNLAGLNAERILIINKSSRLVVWKYQNTKTLKNSLDGVVFNFWKTTKKSINEERESDENDSNLLCCEFNSYSDKNLLLYVDFIKNLAQY